MDTTRKLPVRLFWYSVILVVVFNSLFLAWACFKPGSQDVFVIGDDVGQALGWLLASLLCFVGLQFPWHNTSHPDSRSVLPTTQRWVSLLLSLGIICQFIGQIIYTYYDIHHWAPFPSWADVAYLSTYLFLLPGVLLLPTRQISGITRSRVTLDGFMIMTALVTFSWYFVLGPTMLQGDETALAQVVGSAYPFFDLVLIFCVLRLSFRADISVLRPVVLLLSVGLVIIVITDSIYDYLTLHNSYVNGWQDVGWPIGYMLIGLAAQALNMIQAQQKDSIQSTADGGSVRDARAAHLPEWNSLFPYILIPAVIVLIIYTWRTGTNQTLANGVYLGGAVLIGLVLLRQLVAIRETIFYTKELYRMQQELYGKNEALHEANSQLEEQSAQVVAAYEQQRLLNELKDQLLFNVNHELRTPLTEVQGYLELLQVYKGNIDPDLQDKFITNALHGCEELQSLIHTVLDAIRGDSQEKDLRIEPLKVATIVHNVLELFEPHKRQDYHIELDIPEMLVVSADQEYLRRILLNLLSNAFKYSPRQTTVTISAQPYDIHSPETSAEYVCISVKDTGPGIPPDEIGLLFERFVRLRRDLAGAKRGTGLGLYISKQLVEAMGGRIWVESSGIEGEGSRFCFTLPCSSPSQETSEKSGDITLSGAS
jgi:signal transduction histidine kinase